MYLKVGSTSYLRLKNESFRPEASITGASVPLGEFECDVLTDDDITYGQAAELYDDRDVLYAHFWIVYAQRESPELVHVRAQSMLTVLDKRTMPAEMYSAEPVEDALDFVFYGITIGHNVQVPYELDSAYDNATLTGFAPEQTARERLAWIAYAIGACVRDCFDDVVHVEPIGATEALIPLNMTYMGPVTRYSDYVTGLRAQVFAFEQREPLDGEETVTDNNGTVYVVSRSELTIGNSVAPATAPENEVPVSDGLMLINAGNVSALLTRQNSIYFGRKSVELDCINNADFKPGQRVTFYIDETTMARGYIQSAAFSFGHQAMSSLKIVAVDDIEAAVLTVLYKHGNLVLARRKYTLPVGESYTISAEYIDRTDDTARTIYRPTTATISGTLPSGGATVTVQCETALVLDIRTHVLYVISVDSFTLAADAVTGVIG